MDWTNVTDKLSLPYRGYRAERPDGRQLKTVHLSDFKISLASQRALSKCFSGFFIVLMFSVFPCTLYDVASGPFSSQFHESGPQFEEAIGSSWV